MSNGIHQLAGPMVFAQRYRRLESSLESEVGIIGSGTAALFAALSLLKSGRSVALLAPGSIINGAEAVPANYLSISEPAAPLRWYQELGPDASSLVAAAYRDSISHLEVVAGRTPECRFDRIPAYHVAADAEALMSIERECAIGKTLRSECWFSHDVPLPFPCSGATRYDDHCRVDVAALIRALASEFVMLGGELYEHSPCLEAPSGGADHRIITERGSLTAKSIVLATRIPSAPLSGMVPIHSYFLAAEIDDSLGDGVYVMSGQPRRVICRANCHEPTRIVIRADYEGEDLARQHLRFEELSCFAASHFSVRKVQARWSVHHLQSPSGLPLLAASSRLKRSFVLSCAGNLETPWGVAVGGAAADLVNDKSSTLAQLFAATTSTTNDRMANSRHPLVESRATKSPKSGGDLEKTSGRSTHSSFSNLTGFACPTDAQKEHSFHRYFADREWGAKQL